MCETRWLAGSGWAWVALTTLLGGCGNYAGGECKREERQVCSDATYNLLQCEDGRWVEYEDGITTYDATGYGTCDCARPDTIGGEANVECPGVGFSALTAWWAIG